MDIRVSRYFLAVSREESISGAAESLYMTQPTLSVATYHLVYNAALLVEIS